VLAGLLELARLFDFARLLGATCELLAEEPLGALLAVGRYRLRGFTWLAGFLAVFYRWPL
jgi:hypothetical protein